MRTLSALTVGILTLGLGAGVRDARAASDFSRDVQPILQRACAICHNATLAQGGLSLASRAAALKGGLSGPSIAPGDAAGSLLVKRLSLVPQGLPRMPMGLPPLPDADVAVLRAWIDAGAPWPEAQVAAAKPAGGSAAVPDFLKDIQPILQANCTRCHGPELQRSSLRLDSRSGALRGGLSGPVIVAGKGDASPIVQRLAGRITPRMPFEGPPLPESEIARIKAWIDAGATGPDDSVAAERKHWAYVKPVHAEPPAVKEDGWVRNPIDRVHPGAAREGRPGAVARGRQGDPDPPAEPRPDRPAADAGRGRARSWRTPARTPTRRWSIACSPRRTTASAGPAPGSTWPATPTPTATRRTAAATAWKYRDWVIDALNADMPFDQFTIEQIAGDMLPDADRSSSRSPPASTATRCSTRRAASTSRRRAGKRWSTASTPPPPSGWAARWAAPSATTTSSTRSRRRDYYRMLAFFNNTDYRVQGVGDDRRGQMDRRA